MAEQQVAKQALGWGRGPDGRFVISVDLQVPASDGKVIRVPVTIFVLTKDEEARLAASLAGIVVPALQINGVHP